MKLILKTVLCLFALIVLAGAAAGGYLWYVWSSNLPYIGSMKEYRPPIVTRIYSANGEVIGRLWEEKRIVVPLEEMPEHLVQAFVAAEDARFYEHEGIDIRSIFRAFFKNLRAGEIEQGGSTITQQVTRSLLLKNAERTYRRKAREAILSLQMEREFSKDQILYLYLNQIYLGQGAYGVEAAARTYFRKPAADLTVAESALLAGLPQAPARYSPVTHFEKARSRQKYVLKRMRDEGFITRQQYARALEESIEIQEGSESAFGKAPYFTEHVRRYLLEKYGRDVLYRGGLQVYTTVDLQMQEVARGALQGGLAELDKREGFRGPLRHLEEEEYSAFKLKAVERYMDRPVAAGDVLEGLVEEVRDDKADALVWFAGRRGRIPISEMKWAREPDPEVPYYSDGVRMPSEVLSRGDVVLVCLIERETRKSDPEEGEAAGKEEAGAWKLGLEQEPLVQGALVCMVPETGEVRAMAGGKDFFESQFNRAVQSRRQPGSAFKPIIYAAALDWGMTAGTVLMDAPYVSGPDQDDQVWKPKNYKNKFFGPTLFRTGLIQSRNVITVKILRKIGVPYAIDYARKMGIESDLSPDLSLALGSSGLSLLELTRAYGVFANRGRLTEPIFIRKVVDREGSVVEERQPDARQVISQETAYVMTDLLKAVIQEGTGWRIKALNRPAAGKTGTTNNLWDAWFMGYTPQLVTGVWVGYDDRRVMGKGETGSRAAAPIWLAFMSTVLENRTVVDFEVPAEVVFAKIDAKSGLLASPWSKETVFQAYKEGSEPAKHSPRLKTPKSGEFLQFDMRNLSEAGGS